MAVNSVENMHNRVLRLKKYQHRLTPVSTLEQQ
jgi:hypothetical protein